MSASVIELFAMEHGRTERPYDVGERTDWPIRLKTSARLTHEALASFRDVPVRSVWLMGTGHTDHDVAVAAATFGRLQDVFVPFARALTDDAIRALVAHGADFRRFGSLRSRITDDGLKILATFPELRQARVEQSRVTDEGVAALGACRKLAALHLNGNRGVTGRGLSAFAEHPALQALFVSGTNIDDDGIGHLSGCTELKTLWMSGSRVSERCLLTLPQNRDLDVILPRDLDPEKVAEARRQVSFTVDGVGPDHVIDIPRDYEGMPMELPPQLRGNAPTFVMFTSPTCGPCGWLKTTYDTVRPNLREQFKYVEIEVEQNWALASALEIRSVPTVLLMQFGIVVDRFTGAVGVDKLTERLEAAVAPVQRRSST